MPRDLPGESIEHPRLIKAYKHGWPRVAVDRLIRSKLNGGLHRIYAQGLEQLRAEIGADPRGMILLANHSCWWDLFLVHYLNETVPFDGFGMMEHFNMVRFGFFKRIGAFSVDRNDPSAVRASLHYANALLRRPRAGVWLFPQGKILSNDARPLEFQRGLKLLLRMAAPVRVVPVAFRYDFWQDEQPECFVRFGTPTLVEKDELDSALANWQSRLELELDRLRSETLHQDPTRFTTILAGTRSISDRYAAIRARFLGQPEGAPPLDGGA